MNDAYSLKTGEIIATKLFSASEQEAFAQLSGDRNPMHMDAVAARRTQAGAQVVHGIHVALWSLEKLIPILPGGSGVVSLRVQFKKWVYIGDLATLVLEESSECKTIAKVKVDGLTAVDISVQFAKRLDPGPRGRIDNWEPAAIPEKALDLHTDEMVRCAGIVGFPATPVTFCAAFPNTAANIGAIGVAGLAATSTLVGMVCPGLHSMYKELNVDFRGAGLSCDTSGLHYRVSSYDARFRLAKLQVQCIGVDSKAFDGTVMAVASIPPVGQPPIRELSEHVAPKEFSGSCNLIVGGSRGLGELTAKMLAAGGGRIVITYAVGKAEADSLAREILEWGGSCATMHYDVRLPAKEQLAALTHPVTHVYYFATPPISRAKGRVFAEDRFSLFSDYYLKGFFNLCLALREVLTGCIKVFYPSSVFVSERPPEMTEYAMAKSAGEVLCVDMNRFVQDVKIIVERLPRMETDQTASVVPVRKTDSLEILLPILRTMYSITSTV